MDILGVLILVILYSVAVSSSAKKKKKKRENWKKLQGSDARTPQFDQVFESGDQSAQQPLRPSNAHAGLEREPLATQMEMTLETAGEGDDPCHERELRPAWQSMRFSSASQEGMSLAAEGEDPCHTGEAPAREENPVYDSPILTFGEENAQAIRRQVLSGVIMSEVLTRPQQRRAERKLRRRA